MAPRGEILDLDDVDYRDVTAPGDDFFTAEGRDDDPRDDDDSDDAEDIQLRPVSKLGNKEKFRILQSWWYADSDASSTWRAQATDDLGFVAGDQLNDEDKALLDAEQRPHITFNRVLTILKAVAGMEINGRHEIQFLPRNNDDTAVNEILSGASKWMGDGCDAEDEQSQSFQQCSVTGMGWTESRFSYEKTSQGEYVEEMVDCREMYWDRTAKKKNLVDARRIHRVRRMPLSDAMQMFRGKTKTQLDAVWADTGLQENGSPRSIEEKRIRDGKNSYQDWDDTNEVTIVCTQWWEREPYYLVVDPLTGDKIEMTVPEFKVLRKRMAMFGMPLDSVRLTRQVYKQAFLGNEYLGGGDAPAGNRFSWACMTGEWDAKRRMWFGLVRVMRDPQMWANKFMSQIMQIMNTTAKGGILAERDAFDDQREAEEGYAMADVITWLKPGALSNGQRPKVMEKPGKGDASAYVNLLQFAVTSIKDVTGINPELLGQQDQNQPGILEHMRKQAGMTVLATLFDALRRYRKLVGRIRLHFIQTRMSDGRLIRIVGEEYSGLVPLSREVTTGEYDVIVDDAPTSPNQKEANWAIIQPLLGAFKEQLMAQPEVLAMVLSYSPLPSQLVAAIKKLITQAQNDPQKAQEQEELKKLTIAKLIGEINKDESVATLNRAKAGKEGATAQYDMAIAQNMLHDNNLQRADIIIRGREADAKVGLLAAQTRKQEMEGAASLMKARASHIQVMSKAHNDRVGALAGAQHDLASAFQKRVAAIKQAREPAMPASAQ